MENEQNAPVMSVKDWMITILITFIPLVGIIMLFVWAFGNDENPNRANWAKARLIWAVIFFALGILFLITFGAAIFANFGPGSGY